jgi:DNA polymerase
MTGPYVVRGATDADRWLHQISSLLSDDVTPDAIMWVTDPQTLLPGLEPLEPSRSSAAPAPRKLPPAYRALVRSVLVHRDPDKWSLLYRTAWRLDRDNPALLHIESDPDVYRLRKLERQVQKDVYRMMQFVRFRPVDLGGETRYIAWHRPDHEVLALAAPFFVRRFARMRWSIVTPSMSAHWDGQNLRFAPGAPRPADPSADELEALWRTYYGSVCDPARINPRAMAAQMPRRFWAQLPETGVIAPLIRGAEARVTTMVGDAGRQAGAWPFVPAARTLESLAGAASTCKGCELYAGCTQTVFGSGPAASRIVLVGEQPGDEEDRTGLPFVGPAGALLDRALGQAGLERGQLYLTNAVKHFRFVPEGRVRKHQTPRASHVAACRPWLEAELQTLKPDTVVCLGATATKSLLGSGIKVVQDRGRIFPSRWAARTLVTFHPSVCLRTPDRTVADRLFQTLVADLKLVAPLSQAR